MARPAPPRRVHRFGIVATAIGVADMVAVGVFTSLAQVKDIPRASILLLWAVGWPRRIVFL